MERQQAVRQDDEQDGEDGGMAVAAWVVIACVLAVAAGLWMAAMHAVGTGRVPW